jgi:hypothetical protein
VPAAAILLGAVAVGVAAPATHASDAAVRSTLVRGIGAIRASPAPKRLEPRLEEALARLRRARGSSATGRQARLLAIAGFAWTLRGVRTQLALVANDSGSIEAAVRHARQADRRLDVGARRLRAAARLLGLRVGRLNGH